MSQDAVAIVGTNLDAMIAAHVCILRDRPFALFGAPFGGGPPQHWLGVPIPAFHSHEPEGMLTTLRHGTPEEYQQKAFGDFTPGPTAWDYGERDVPAAIWRTQLFWDHYRSLPTQGIIPLPSLLKDFEGGVIIADKPQMMCSSTHQFLGRSVWVADQAMCRNQDGQSWIRVLDGTKDHSWYQTSSVFGIQKTLYGGPTKPPLSGVHQEVIPLYSTCTCGGERVLRVGRGLWSNARPDEALSTAVFKWLN